MTQTKCDKNGESANSITETPLTWLVNKTEEENNKPSHTKWILFEFGAFLTCKGVYVQYDCPAISCYVIKHE